MRRNISRPTSAAPPKEIPPIPHAPSPPSLSPSPSSLSPLPLLGRSPPSSSTTAVPVITYDHTPSFSYT
eukprot:685129-Prorocentrum_minimum.AAC.1